MAPELLLWQPMVEWAPERWFLGSIADKVIRSSPVPVLLIQPQESATQAAINHIQLPLDGSEQSETALPYASFLAKSLSLPITVVETISLTSFISGRS